MAYHADRLTLSAVPRANRRAALFRESPIGRAERWALGLARALMPNRIARLPGLLRLCFDEIPAPNYALPDPERALANPPGLAGIVHDLSLPTLLDAYRRGLYTLAHVAPLKWWSPPQRSLLFFRNFHISNNLARLTRQGRYSVTFDRDFEAVIAACAGAGPAVGTSPRLRRASCASTPKPTMPVKRIRSRSGTRRANWSPAATASRPAAASRRSRSSLPCPMPRVSA